jgi:hypothetical protein
MRGCAPALGLEMQDSLWLLTEDDRRAYEKLHHEMEQMAVRTPRKQLGTMFKDVIAKVHLFAIHNDGNDAIRCLVCGSVWLEDALGISTRRLTKLIGRCRSLINAGLQSFGYGTVPTTPEHIALLVKVFPFLRENVGEMRQWTIRDRIFVPSTMKSEVKPKHTVIPVPELDRFDEEENQISLFGEKMSPDVDYTKFLTYDDLTLYGFPPMDPDDD